MPKQFRARTTTTKQKRQALMAAIVFAMSPMLVQTSTSAEGTFTRPPLPLTGTTGQLPSGDDVKVNPFCMPAPVAEATPILLASGTEPSNIRLQPIGEAIGLHNIDQGSIEHSDTPAITVETPIASEVQANPLIDQVAHASTKTGQVNQQSSIVLLPMKRMVIAAAQPEPLMDPVAEPVTIDPITAGPAVVEKIIEQDIILQQEMVRAEPTAEVEVPAKNIETEPVFFSFSDDSESDLLQDVILQEPVTSRFATELSRGATETTLNEKERSKIDAFARQESEQVQPLILNDMAEAKPIGAPVLEGVGRPQSNHFVNEPEFVTERQSVAGSVVEGPEPTLHSRRYRPPVDVQAVPIAMERSSQNDTHSQIDSVVVSAPSLASEAEASKPVITSLFLNRAQVRSLTVGAELHSVKIGDKSVCQAFAAGPNQIKLIGTGNGTTRLVVYAKSAQGDSQPQVRSFDVHVKDAVEATGTPTMNRPDMLNQTIQQMFPDADVVVKRSGNELVVMGRCGSEAVAKKIVRLVRRTCLVPVKDELRVR